jgi:hypothetical protein
MHASVPRAFQGNWAMALAARGPGANGTGTLCHVESLNLQVSPRSVRPLAPPKRTSPDWNGASGAHCRGAGEFATDKADQASPSNVHVSLRSSSASTLHPFDETRPGISRAGPGGAPGSVACVESQFPKRILIEEAVDIGALSRLGPGDGGEVEQLMLGPPGEQAEDIAEVGPGLDAA